MYEYNGGLINRRVWKFFIPGFFATIAVTLSMFLDILLVGRMVGPMEMGAVQMAMPLTMFFNMMYMLFGTGGEALVASAKGARNGRRADMIFTLTLAVVLVISLAIALLGNVFTTQIAAALDKGNAEMTPFVARYIRVMFIGCPLLIGVMSCTPFVKADAMPALSSLIAVFSNVVNIGSKLIYMGPMKLGLDGAALGTITGYAAGLALLCFCYLFNRKRRVLNFVPLAASDIKEIVNIFLTGLPSSLGQGLGAVTSWASNAIVLSIAGSKGIVAMTVASSCTIFISSFRYASPMTIVPLVGAMFGERDWWSMVQTTKRVLKICVIGTALCVAMLIAFPDAVLSAFGVKDPSIMAMGVTALRFFSVNVVFSVIINIIMTYYQTTGRKAASIAISAGNELVDLACRWACGMLIGVTGLWLSPLLASAIMLLLIFCYTRYVERTTKNSEIGYHGKFLLHELDASFAEKNTIPPTEEAAEGLASQIKIFAEKNGILAEKAEEAARLVRNAALGIIKKNGVSGNSVDAMTVIWKGEIQVKLRDDGPKFGEGHEEDGRISHVAIMGYNDTFIKV